MDPDKEIHEETPRNFLDQMTPGCEGEVAQLFGDV